jgi:NodT family efflux transporter outer membrane factor (OMF) lipoprotein
MNARLDHKSIFRKPRLLFALAILALLSGCAVGPNYRRPPAPVPQTFKEAPPEGWKTAQPNEAAMRGDWWEMYNDQQLNALEQQVNINNQNVKLAEAQFREAREQVRIARSAFFPTVTGNASDVHSASPLLPRNQLVNTVTSTGTLYNLSADLSYQLDVFGSVRRSVAASYANAQVSDADLENIRLTMHAQLAQFYFQLKGQDTLADLLTRSVAAYEQYLKLTQDRFELGVASGADVAQAQTQLDTTRAQLIDVGVQRAQFEHAIAILIGKPPAELTIPPAIWQTPPPAMPVLLPSALLERRPDIAASERQVAAANEQIGVAKAALYPSISISAVAGFQGSSLNNLFSLPTSFWTVGPQLAQTLFAGGRLRAQVRLQQDAYDATAAFYRQTVLTAFQGVEDNLAALRILEQEAGAQDRAVKAAQASLDISTEQYKQGIATYLQVLTAQTTALQNEQTAVSILTRRMTASVLLVEALGGGWDASQLPTRDVILHGK